MTPKEEKLLERAKENTKLLSDLLNQVAKILGIPEKDWGEPDTLCDAVEALQSENARLRKALEEVLLTLREIGVGTIHCWPSMEDAQIDIHNAVFWEGKAVAMQKKAWEAQGKLLAALSKPESGG